MNENDLIRRQLREALEVVGRYRSGTRDLLRHIRGQSETIQRQSRRIAELESELDGWQSAQIPNRLGAVI